MSINFPVSLDTSVTIPAEGASTPLSTNHVTAHQNIQDAIEVIEAKIGIDSSAVTTSHDYKLSEITGSDKAVGKTATQTLTNKTLTSPVVNVGSDATGDMYYRNAGVLTRIAIGTDNQILKLNGTTPNWEAETVTVAATEAVEGISRLATAAQITAGTASEASYPLVVTPDQLALSTPVFNGSGLTSLPTNKITTVIPAVTVGTSSTAENTLLSYSLAGGVLGTSNAVLITGYFTTANSGSALTVTVRLKYGATTLFSPTFTLSGGVTSFTHKISWLIAGSGATNTQNSDVVFSYTSANNPGTIGVATSTEDSTASKAIVITAQSSVSDAGLTVTLINVIITRVY